MNIAVMPGDGVGKEVIPQGLRVLKVAAEKFGFSFRTTDYPFGGEHYLATWMHPIGRARATAWKPLADYLSAYYQPPVEITTTPGNPPVLIYVRKAD